MYRLSIEITKFLYLYTVIIYKKTSPPISWRSFLFAFITKGLPDHSGSPLLLDIQRFLLILQLYTDKTHVGQAEGSDADGSYSVALLAVLLLRRNSVP